MANFDQNTQRKTGFFHALGYVLTKDVNDPANEKYKSSHNVRSLEIWTDNINYSPDFITAVVEASNNSALNQHGDETSIPTSLALLYPLKDSNGQAWFLDSGIPVWSSTGFTPTTGWVKPLVSPVDVTNTSGSPSSGLSFRLYTPTGSLVSALNGKWEVDYFGAFLKFNVGSTPYDAGNGLGFVVDFAALVSSPDKIVYLQSNGPRSVAFNYSGQFLDDLLLNLSVSGSSGVGGSGEWQDSVKGYLMTVGNDTTINGATSTSDQISYLTNNYELFYIKTTTVDVGNTYSLSDNLYYQYTGTSFISHTPTTLDDDNRYLKLENSIILDTVALVGTSSIYILTQGDTVQKDRIIEFLGTSSTGLTQSGWRITNPRTGMVTTSDDLSNRRTRYTGVSNGWVELFDEITYKVNVQKGIVCELTSVDYDVAFDGVVQFEPTGDKSIDVLINGVEVFDNYSFAKPSVFTNITPFSIGVTNSVDVPDAQSPLISEYLRFDLGATFNYRKVVSLTSSGGTTSVTYGGYDVPIYTNLYKFSTTLRSNNIAHKNDILLWIGTGFYELDNGDLLTLEYITADKSVENL